MDIQSLINKFPMALKKALESSLIELPDTLVTEYEPFPAYRCVKISATKQQIEKTDFDSQIEKRMRTRGTENLSEIEDSDKWAKYSCSCYTDPSELEKAMRLPQKKTRVAQGTISEIMGAYVPDEKTSHIDWFLYNGVDPSDEFKLVDLSD